MSKVKMIELLFWLSVAAILYTYFGYPLIVWLLARLRRRTVLKADIFPSVSVVLACHNEERNIEARIKNLLECDYPRKQLEIVIVSDGSTDLTTKIARRHASERIRLFEYKEQKGKAIALNIGVDMAKGEVVLFADARQSFERRAIKELVANFADASVGAVSGELLLDGAAGSSVGEGVGLYWRYEKWIRKSEGRFNSVIGATGAIYAIRRELWQPLPDSTILDDVYTPMQIALGGRRVVFEENARAYDRATESTGHEFVRKVRTLTGNYQLCQLMPRLLFPNNALLFQFYSHKLMRLAAPIFFLLIFATNMFIAAEATGSGSQLFYRAIFAGQLAFYGGVAAGAYLLRHNRRLRLLNLAYVFSLMNAAALIGLLFFVLGKRDVWVRGGE
jgi:cellulose synthase/poly-beta-1,6-N-acetylglucosamine synthase-like glycosyltransferase